jgi:hypothetical protein
LLDTKTLHKHTAYEVRARFDGDATYAPCVSPEETFAY